PELAEYPEVLFAPAAEADQQDVHPTSVSSNSGQTNSSGRDVQYRHASVDVAATVLRQRALAMLTSRAVVSEKVLRSERRSAWLDVGTDGDRDPGFGGNHEERLDRDKGRKTQAGAGHHASDRQDGDDHTVLVIVVPESA